MVQKLKFGITSYFREIDIHFRKAITKMKNLYYIHTILNNILVIK